MREIISGPSIRPVSIDEIKEQSRIDLDDEDLLLVDMLDAAIEKIEGETGTILSKRVYRLTLPRFEPVTNLKASPVLSVSSVKYIDMAGIIQTLPSGSYRLIDKIERATLIPVYGEVWPDTRCDPEAVIIEFEAGYDADKAPAVLRQAVLKTVAGLYDYREDITTANARQLPEGVRSLIRDHMKWGL